MTKLLKGEEVAEALHISRSQACHLMRSDELQTVRFGHLVRVRPEDLEQFIQQHLEG